LNLANPAALPFERRQAGRAGEVAFSHASRNATERFDLVNEAAARPRATGFGLFAPSMTLSPDDLIVLRDFR
jgi:hypothetical protein